MFTGSPRSPSRAGTGATPLTNFISLPLDDLAFNNEYSWYSHCYVCSLYCISRYTLISNVSYLNALFDCINRAIVLSNFADSFHVITVIILNNACDYFTRIVLSYSEMKDLLEYKELQIITLSIKCFNFKWKYA